MKTQVLWWWKASWCFGVPSHARARTRRKSIKNACHRNNPYAWPVCETLQWRYLHKAFQGTQRCEGKTDADGTKSQHCSALVSHGHGKNNMYRILDNKHVHAYIATTVLELKTLHKWERERDRTSLGYLVFSWGAENKDFTASLSVQCQILSASIQKCRVVLQWVWRGSGATCKFGYKDPS